MWTGRYELDFGKLALDAETQSTQQGELPELCNRFGSISSQSDTGKVGSEDKDKDEEEEEDEDEDRPMFSLVTGQYRQAKRYDARPTSSAREETHGADPSAVVLRNQNDALSVMPDSAAGESRPPPKRGKTAQLLTFGLSMHSAVPPVAHVPWARGSVWRGRPERARARPEWD